MDTQDLMDGVRNLVLMNIGAVATAADKSREVADALIARGERAVDEGKTLNEELTHKVTSTVKETSDKGIDVLLKAHLAALDPEERADFVARVAGLASDVSDGDATHVEVEDAGDEAPSEAAADEPASEEA